LVVWIFSLFTATRGKGIKFSGVVFEAKMGAEIL
jgi:hypothetical protein